MKRLFVVLFAMLLLGVVAGPAYAGTDPGTGGYIEVCKAANPQLTGLFSFTIASTVGTKQVSIAQGTCTQPIAVKNGNVIVSEDGSTAGMNDAGGLATAPTREFLKDPTVTAYGKDGAVAVSPGADAFTKQVTVPAGTDTSVVTITFANTLDPGVIEVCKNVTDPALTGTWSFTVTGGNGFSQATTTSVGNCSAPITLPAGHFKVVEDGIQSVSSITATQVAGTVDAVRSVNLATTTVVAMVARGDASKQTIVTYTNSLVRLKLCKAWDSSAVAPVTFPFTFVATGNAGPAGPIAPLSLAPGTTLNPNCVVVGTYRAGTRVAITEGITPGTKVSNITSNQGIVPDTLSKPNRTVTVDLMAGETVVIYTDKPADPGWLKICKTTTLDSPVIPAGTVFTFNLTAVTGGGAPATVTVAAGAPGTTMCSAPVPSKFDATWTVTEAARANTTVTAIAAVPDWVVVDGVNTNQPVLTGVNLVARSVNVTIGESNTTELTFTNKDPVEAVAGGSSSGSAAEVVATGSQTVVGAAATADTAKATASKGAALKAQKVAQLKKQLATLKATQKKLQKAFLAAKTKAAKNSLAKRIAVVKASQAKINLQLKLLK